MEVNCKAHGSREVIKDFLKIANVLQDRSDNDKGIVSVLEDGTGEVIHKRVKEEAIPGGLKEHLL